MHPGTVVFGMLRPHIAIARTVVPDVPAHGWDEWLDTVVHDGTLHPLEASLARSLPAPRRATFVAGRQALREALGALPAPVGAPPDQPILRTHRGAPALPDMVTGSVTHKRTLAMAAVAPRDGALQHLGIDLERRPTVDELHRPSIARKILTSRELATLEQFAGDALAAREHTLVHFAIKEAVYKAIDPFVERYVRFTEVELDLHPGGEARVTLHLPEASVADVQVTAQWQLEGDWIVAAAYSLR